MAKPAFASPLLAVTYIGLTQALFPPMVLFDVGTGASVFFPLVGASIAVTWIGGPWMCLAIFVTTALEHPFAPEQYLHVTRHVLAYGGLGLLLRQRQLNPLSLTARDAGFILVGIGLAGAASAALVTLHLGILHALPPDHLADTLLSFWVGDAAGGILALTGFAALFRVITSSGPSVVSRRDEAVPIIVHAVAALLGLIGLAFALKALSDLLTLSIHVWFLLSLAACGVAFWTGPIVGTLAAIAANALTVCLFPKAMQSLPILDVQLHMLAVGAAALLIGAARNDHRRSIRALTEREHRAQALARQNELYAHALRSIPVAVTIQDAAQSGEPLFSNAAFDALGIPVPSISSADLPASGQEMRLERSDGSKRDIRVQVAPVRGSQRDVVGIVCVYRDETDDLARMRAEKESERMRALGYLAGGIAHEINNLLHPIQNLAYAVGQQGGTLTEQQQRLLSIIQQCAVQAGTVVHPILNYTRTAKQERRQLNIAGAIRDSMAMVSRGLSPAIAPQVDIADGPASAMISPVEMTQVLTNLVINAAKAVESNTAKARIKVHGQPIINGDDVSYRLTVADNGCGMDRETLSRVFTPFFTTRADAGGTGLGLTIVRNIVSEWGGTVEVTSSPGNGCSVILTFPASHI